MYITRNFKNSHPGYLEQETEYSKNELDAFYAIKETGVDLNIKAQLVLTKRKEFHDRNLYINPTD